MYRLAYAYSFVQVASIGAVFVFLSDVKETYGLPEWGIGLIASVGFLVVLPVTFAVSPIADRGYNGRLLIVATIFAVAGNLLFGYGSTLWHFVASRGMLGVAVGIGGIAVRKALIGNVVEGAGKKLGTLLSAYVAGFILGPFLGARLEPFGFETVFVVFAIASGLLGLPLISWAWNTPVSTSKMTVASVVRLMSQPGIQGAVLGYVVVFGSVGIFDSVVDIYLTDLGASNSQIGTIILIVGVPLVLVPGWAGGLMERSDTRRMFILAVTLEALTVAGYGIYPSIFVFAVAGFLHSTVEGFAFPGSQIIMVNETGASQAAAGQALLESAGSLVAGITAFVGPPIYDAFGPRALFMGYGVVILLGSMGVRVLLARKDNDEWAPADPVIV